MAEIIFAAIPVHSDQKPEIYFILNKPNRVWAFPGNVIFCKIPLFHHSLLPLIIPQNYNLQTIFQKWYLNVEEIDHFLTVRRSTIYRRLILDNYFRMIMNIKVLVTIIIKMNGITIIVMQLISQYKIKEEFNFLN